MSSDVEIKEQVYEDSRPAEFFAPFHQRAREHAPGPMYELVRVVTLANALISFRAVAIGSENVPNGPVILAPNHASFMDHFFTAGFLRRHVQFMAKSQMFGSGMLSFLLTYGGNFPVRRGHADEDAFATAFAILKRDGAVGMYPEGGRSRNGEIADVARPGIGRLAMESGAPVVPVAIHGSHQVRNWRRGQFPKIHVEYGTPLRFEPVETSSRELQQQAAEMILGRIRELHGGLAERYPLKPSKPPREKPVTPPRVKAEKPPRVKAETPSRATAEEPVRVRAEQPVPSGAEAPEQDRPARGPRLTVPKLSAPKLGTPKRPGRPARAKQSPRPEPEQPPAAAQRPAPPAPPEVDEEAARERRRAERERSRASAEPARPRSASRFGRRAARDDAPAPPDSPADAVRPTPPAERARPVPPAPPAPEADGEPARDPRSLLGRPRPNREDRPTSPPPRRD